MEDCITEIVGDTEYCSDEEDGPYIEIELDTAAVTPSTSYNDDENKNSCIMDDDVVLEHEKEYQLRISISVSLPEVQKEMSVNVHNAEPKVAPCIIPTVMSCSDDAADDDDDAITRTCADSQAKMPLQHPRPRGLWEIPQPDDDGQTTLILGTSTTRVIPYHNVDDVYARKQPSFTTTTTTTTNGIMMKLLIKFRGSKIGALFASLIKPRQPCQINNKEHKSSNKKSKTFFQCYDQKGLINPSNGRCTSKKEQGRRSKQGNLEDDSIFACLRNNKKSCRVMDMDLGALRGIFNAKGMGIGQRGSKSKRRTGTTSCNNSPIHDEGFSICSSESSIQAAIAYCKSSLGQTSDFTFTSSVGSTPSRFVA